ncbi:hypothetical protein V8E51_011276 [Hyaloscypha variabilis]
MLSVYNYLSTKLVGRESSRGDSKPSGLELASFHLFSSLPPELRRKIWHFALPTRLIEASLDLQDGQWGCCVSLSKHGTGDRRQLPVLFAVNIESREFCLKEYILFANTYLHPKLDLLYISWLNADLITPRPKFYAIQDQPLLKFHSIAMTIQRSSRSQERFGAFVNCLRQLGTPKEIQLCLVGPKLPSLFSTTTGFSITNGNMVVLLDWANKVEENMSQEVRSHVMRALEAEQAAAPGFRIPALSTRLYYMFSGP